ncbi:MAG: DUF4252 domain-containing protein [Muribaculaceae bacterium]|nr:DUF4252 domain-containing protein [Muribaculaceae bacterium]
MKKLILNLLLIFSSLAASAEAFDSVFNSFKDAEDAEYVKVPSLLVRLGASRVNHIDSLPMNIKITGIRVLEVPESIGPKFEKAVMEAGRKCELMLEATDEGDKAIIWLEPNGKKAYNKMIIYSDDDYSLVELSGKFSPKSPK